MIDVEDMEGMELATDSNGSFVIFDGREDDGRVAELERQGWTVYRIISPKPVVMQ